MYNNFEQNAKCIKNKLIMPTIWHGTSGALTPISVILQTVHPFGPNCKPATIILPSKVDFKQLHHPTVFNPSITLNPERCVNLNNKVNEIVPVKYRNTSTWWECTTARFSSYITNNGTWQGENTFASHQNILERACQEFPPLHNSKAKSKN